LIPQEELQAGTQVVTYRLFKVQKEESDINTHNIITLNRQKFASLYYSGDYDEEMRCLDRILDFISSNGYTLCGDAVELAHIDMSVTDDEQEMVFEIQVPITLT